MPKPVGWLSSALAVYCSAAAQSLLHTAAQAKPPARQRVFAPQPGMLNWCAWLTCRGSPVACNGCLISSGQAALWAAPPLATWCAAAAGLDEAAGQAGTCMGDQLDG